MRRTILAMALVALLPLGCGGSSDGESTGATASRGTGSDAYVAKADRICAEMIADSRRMGAQFRSLRDSGVDPLTLTTEELVKPAIPVLEDSARRLRALEREAGSVEYESYVALFDPLVSLARERAAAGDASDGERAERLELLSLELGTLQRNLAREAGLKTCDVDYIETFSSGGSG